MNNENTNAIDLVGISKHFGDFVAIDNIDLQINDGEFFTLVGPSGSGKTTMIRMLVGMDKPTAGEMKFYGKRINEVPANKRPSCMVFQNLALFPHKSVGQNVTFPMKIAGVSKEERRAKARDLLEQVQLPADYYDKSVAQCSGGERQRVALARALAFDPEILFFDEPLSALDFRLRKTLEKALKHLQKETGKTFVYITHSLEEAMVMSDRIGIMRDGKLVQIGTPKEIYTQPANLFVAQFMGDINQFNVKPATKKSVTDAEGRKFKVTKEVSDVEEFQLVVRPEVMNICTPADKLPNRIKAKILAIYPLGSRVQYMMGLVDTLTDLKESDERWLVEELQNDSTEHKVGDEVEIGWHPKDAIVVVE